MSRRLRRLPFAGLAAPALLAGLAGLTGLAGPAAAQPAPATPPAPVRQPALARPRPPGTMPLKIPTVAPVKPPTTAPVPAAPAAPAAAAPPTTAPRPVAHVKKAPPKEPEPDLPDPEIRVRLIAPSAEGKWTLRLENEGSRWVRVPADVRLLHLTVESGDTLGKQVAKPAKCQAPASLRPAGFPEPRALLLGPGDAYVETFDPRLFCFGKDAAALTGGAIVRARYGWEAPKGAKKVEAPFAVESTEFPPPVAPQKQLVAPTIVLSWEAPDGMEEVKDKDGDPKGDAKTARDEKDAKAEKEAAARDEKDAREKGAKGKDEAVSLPPDENAPRFELKASPHVDAVSGYRVAITVTATNVGHRPAMAAIRSRMVAFRVDGPDGVQRCGVSGATRSIPRDGYRTIKPGASASLTILVEEACRQSLFRRPGLYRVTPSLHLVESGSELGLAAYTGVARAKEPTLVRVSSGPDPFYPTGPKAVRAPKPTEPADPAATPPAAAPPPAPSSP